MNYERFYRYLNLIIFVLLVLAVVLYFPLSSGNKNCSENPLVYGAKQFYDKGLELSCTCTPLDPAYKSFYFNHEKIFTDEKTNFNINFSSGT